MKYGFVLWDEKNTDCKTSLGIESYRDVIVVASEEVFTEAMFRIQSRVKKKKMPDLCAHLPHSLHRVRGKVVLEAARLSHHLADCCQHRAHSSHWVPSPSTVCCSNGREHCSASDTEIHASLRAAWSNRTFSDNGNVLPPLEHMWLWALEPWWVQLKNWSLT